LPLLSLSVFIFSKMKGGECLLRHPRLVLDMHLGETAMRLILIVSLSFLTFSACGPMASNEGLIDRPDDYHGREFYLAPPGGVPKEEIERQLPGTPTGPKIFTIRGQSLVFPVNGPHRYRNDWQEPREMGKRRHEGNDLLSTKMIPVVAAADGEVGWVHGQSTKKCCSIGLNHADGWQTVYLHLNNDTPGVKPEDNKGNGVAQNLKMGSKVKAGELIGWVGDSGNAEATTPHLHFELHYKETPVNPYLILKQARHLKPQAPKK
jgi:murein DD-endopeptidase MepM/ murein hydrolase activator NlpD